MEQQAVEEAWIAEKERVATEVEAAEEARLVEEARIAEEEWVEAERKRKEAEEERQAAMVLAEYQRKEAEKKEVEKVEVEKAAFQKQEDANMELCKVLAKVQRKTKAKAKKEAVVISVPQLCAYIFAILFEFSGIFNRLFRLNLLYFHRKHCPIDRMRTYSLRHKSTMRPPHACYVIRTRDGRSD